MGETASTDYFTFDKGTHRPFTKFENQGKCAPQVGQFQDVQCSRNLTRLYTSSSARLRSVSFKRFNAQDISRVFTRAIAAKWYCKEAGLVVRYI